MDPQSKKTKGNAKPRARVQFERHASRVVYDKDAKAFVVTWTKCNLPEKSRLDASRDPIRWMPSVASIVTLCDRGLVRTEDMIHAAEAIGRAYDAGDRDMLDTEEAKRAAEMVRDLARMKAEDMDICGAMQKLMAEIAHVRFSSASFDVSVIDALDKACDECFSVEGFASWPVQSMRRRFLYCLNRKERTDVAYTLISLLFTTGSCPLLSLSDQRKLRSIAFGKVNDLFGGSADWHSADSAKEFFRFALFEMAASKAAGLYSIGAKMTQQQLADSVALPQKQGEKDANR